MVEFYIAERLVGDDVLPMVVVEIGINHEGSLETAFELVDAAHRAGAEVVKHQTHVIDDEMSAAAQKVIPGNADESIYEIMARCALNEADERALKDYVEKLGMIFISTPFSRAAADRLERMDVSAYKIGSGECNNYPLLKHVASFGKPIILSTGMNTLESVGKSVAIFREAKVPFALLHCTNVYPTPHRLVRLGAMGQLKKAFPDAVVGLSDHTVSNNSCLGAVALGAGVIERHFTDHYDRPGPDIEVSMDEAALRNMIVGVREIYECRGGEKGPVEEEQVTIDFAFATVVTTRSIKQGEKFSEQNIWVKRPGTGAIPAEHYESILGRVATEDLISDEHLSWDHISDSEATRA